MMRAGAVRSRVRLGTPWGWIEPPAEPSVPSGVNLRRSVLDPLIRDTAAGTPGVELIMGHTVHGLLRDGDAVSGAVARDSNGNELQLRAKLLIGADGRGSRVAKLAGVDTKTYPHGRIAYGGYYEGPPPAGSPDASFWLLDPDMAAAFPTDSGLTFYAAMPVKEHGADFRSDPAKAHEHLRPQLEFEMIPWTMKKPVVASVQGHVMGGGCELVMLCDLTIAADNATFGEPEVRFSSVGPAIVMPMIIGYKKARELLYFGDTIGAKAALDLGMVNRLVPVAERREASLRYAKRLSLISPEALFATKRAVNRVADAAGFRTALYAGLDVVGPLYATKTEFGQRFRDIVASEGIPAAVRWRAAQFRE